jgi:hypothetical protein
LIARSRRG